MERGDISSERVPRILIEFEGLLAHQVEVPVAPSLTDKLLRREPDPTIVWDLDDEVVKVMWDLDMRVGIEMDVITEQGEAYALQLADRLNDEDVPVHRVWAYEPRRLARQLAVMPYVSAVYTGDIQHALLYGSRGRLVTPGNLLQIGRF